MIFLYRLGFTSLLVGFESLVAHLKTKYHHANDSFLFLAPVCLTLCWLVMITKLYAYNLRREDNRQNYCSRFPFRKQPNSHFLVSILAYSSPSFRPFYDGGRSLCTVFANFLQNKSSLHETWNFTTFVDSPADMYGQNMRIVISFHRMPPFFR